MFNSSSDKRSFLSSDDGCAHGGGGADICADGIALNVANRFSFGVAVGEPERSVASSAPDKLRENGSKRTHELAMRVAGLLKVE